MDLSSGVNLGQMLLAAIVILVTGGIAWGSITQRVHALEREVEALTGLSERLARIEEKTSSIKDDLGKLTGSWLFREPPSYDQISREPPPRSRTRSKP